MNIEYKDFESQSVQKVKEANKIKFKQSSFSVIYNTFKDFVKRKIVNIVDKKLEKAKNDLENYEFKRGDDLVNSYGITNKDQIIYKKTKAIEKMKKILNFLERDNYNNISSGAEEDRPLRIRTDMEKGVKYNVTSIEKSDGNNNELNDTKKVIEEETAKVNEKIDNIKAAAPEEEKEQENFENITVEDTKKSVDKSFEEEAKDATPVTTENIQESIEEKIEAEAKDVTPVTAENIQESIEEKIEEEAKDANTITAEDIKESIEEKIDEEAIAYEDVEKIAKEEFNVEPEKAAEVTPITNIERREIGGINALPQEDTEDINKGIFNTEEENKEETVTTEEENREVPVVAPDREEEFIKANEEFKEAEEVYEKIMNETVSEEEATKEVEESDEKISEETPVENEKKEIPEEENIGFDFSDASIEDMKKAAEVTTSQKDLTAMMLKIKMLKKEEERTKEQIKKAKEEAALKEVKYQETYKMFDDYCNELEAKCNKNLEEKEAIINKSKEKDDAINKMLSAMGTPEENNSKKKK
ncbi:MAG: hypothetical protein Q4E69_00240 [Bacilli bacterium]|nr:hypothetical protein [Bacilli bacterium]